MRMIVRLVVSGMRSCAIIATEKEYDFLMDIITKKEFLADTGEEVETFRIKTRKGVAMGFLHNQTLCIHHIYGEGCMKGIMGALCRRYNMNRFRFLMVINPNLKNIVHGRVVMIPPDDPRNPFGEWLEEIHGEWKIQ